MLAQLLLFELYSNILLNLGAVLLIKRLELILEGSQLEKLSFLVQFGPLDLLDLLLLGGELFRQHLLLVVEDLEVFLGAQKLVVVVSGLLLCVEDFGLLALDDLLQLDLLVDDELHVLLETSELGLKAGDGGATCVLLAMLLEGLSLELLHLGL